MRYVIEITEDERQWLIEHAGSPLWNKAARAPDVIGVRDLVEELLSPGGLRVGSGSPRHKLRRWLDSVDYDL